MKLGGCLILFIIGAVVVVMLFSGLRGMGTTTPQTVAATANAIDVDLDPDSTDSMAGTLIIVVMVIVVVGVIIGLVGEALKL